MNYKTFFSGSGNRDYFWSWVNSQYCFLCSFWVLFVCLVVCLFGDYRNFLIHVLISIQRTTIRGSLQFSRILSLSSFYSEVLCPASTSHFCIPRFSILSPLLRDQFHLVFPPCIEGDEVYIFSYGHSVL